MLVQLRSDKKLLPQVNIHCGKVRQNSESDSHGIITVRRLSHLCKRLPGSRFDFKFKSWDRIRARPPVNEKCYELHDG